MMEIIGTVITAPCIGRWIMIKLDISIKINGPADGTYRVRAKGCIDAMLCWVNSQGELLDWTLFAYVPITLWIGSLKATWNKD